MEMESKANELLQDLCKEFLISLSMGVVPSLETRKQAADKSVKAWKKSLYSAESAKSCAQLFALAGLVMELTTTGKTISQRDVYYSFKHLFSNQGECNSMILELGRLIRLRRYEMNIIPAAKGFVCGLVRFRFLREDDSDWIDASAAIYSNGVTITHDWVSLTQPQLEIEVAPAVQLVLVVEKEGVFHRLCEDKFFMRVPCVMVTGCGGGYQFVAPSIVLTMNYVVLGFPDHSTRALVHKISVRYPNLPVIGLCDYNPFGLALLLTFRFPSRTSGDVEGAGLQAPLKWLGLRAAHLRVLPSSPSSQLCAFSNANIFQQFNKADHSKVNSMLQSQEFDHLPPQYREELLHMQRVGSKCELEALYSLGLTYLEDFLESAILNRDFV